jgi:ABC-type spermidine/putrescine transport system permease subunit I
VALHASRGEHRQRPVRVRRLTGMSRRHRLFGLARPYLQVAPALLLLAAFFAIPLALAAWHSIGGWAFRFARYAEIFTDPLYLAVFLRTLEIASIVTMLCVVLGYPIAHLLAVLERRPATLLGICLLVPLFTSFLIRTYGWMVILGRQGVLNKTLMALGVVDAPIRLLGTSTAVYIGLVHVLIPFAVFTMYATMAGLDRRLVTAAQVMGATPTRAFVRVYLPMSLPGVVSAAVLVFIMALGFFITPALLGSPGDTMIAQLIVTQITTLLNLDFGIVLSMVLLAAIAVVLVASSLVVPLEHMWSMDTDARSRPARIGAFGAQLRSVLWRAVYCIEATIHRAIGRPRWLFALLLRLHAALVVMFLLLPLGVIYVLSFSASPYLVFPPPGFSLRWYEAFLASPEWRDALVMSLKLAAIVASLSLAVGGSAAFAIVRGALRAKKAIVLCLLSPLFVPVIIVSLGLYVSTDDLGLLGTFAGLVIGHMVVAVPYAVVVLVPAVRGLDRSIEHAAATLGAPPPVVLRRVVAPLLMPGFVSAWTIAFLHSFDEFLVTLFLLVRQPPTLPIKMWADIHLQLDPTLSAASGSIVALTVLVVLVSQGRGLFRRRPLAVAVP